MSRGNVTPLLIESCPSRATPAW